MGHFKKHQQIIFCLGSLLLCAITGIICYRLGLSAAPAEMSAFTVSALADEEIGYTNFHFEDTKSPYTSMTYVDLAEVTIDIGGKQMPLDEAIRNKKITIEELIAQAQLDAQNGVCTEVYSSERGLTTYSYLYPTHEYIVRHDTFRKADDSLVRIDSFLVVAPGKHDNVGFGWALIDDDGNINRLLEEDWGLTFTCVDAAPTGIELEIRQRKGQQFGELFFDGISLNRVEDGRYTLIGQLDKNFFSSMQEPIPENTTTTYSLNLGAQYGSLEPGDYELWIGVWDKYDINQKHPFLRKYDDNQSYTVYFTIP